MTYHTCLESWECTQYDGLTKTKVRLTVIR